MHQYLMCIPRKEGHQTGIGQPGERRSFLPPSLFSQLSSYRKPQFPNFHSSGIVGSRTCSQQKSLKLEECTMQSVVSKGGLVQYHGLFDFFEAYSDFP